MFLHSETLVEIPKYDGTLISYQSIRFEGSPELVFWRDFIDGYLKNEPLEVLQQVGELAQNSNQDICECLYEAEKLLGVMGHRIFEKMADTDQKLKGNGIKKGDRKDVSGRISGFKTYISEHRKIIELEFSPKSAGLPESPDDLIDFKPNFFGVGVNLNAAWKKYGSTIMKKINLTKFLK